MYSEFILENAHPVVIEQILEDSVFNVCMDGGEELCDAFIEYANILETDDYDPTEEFEEQLSEVLYPYFESASAIYESVLFEFDSELGAEPGASKAASRAARAEARKNKKAKGPASVTQMASTVLEREAKSGSPSNRKVATQSEERKFKRMAGTDNTVTPRDATQGKSGVDSSEKVERKDVANKKGLLKRIGLKYREMKRGVGEKLKGAGDSIKSGYAGAKEKLQKSKLAGVASRYSSAVGRSAIGQAIKSGAMKAGSALKNNKLSKYVGGKVTAIGANISAKRKEMAQKHTGQQGFRSKLGRMVAGKENVKRTALFKKFK